MKRSAIALMSVCASLLMVQTAAAQSVARQAPPRQVPGDRAVAPPTVPSINVAQFTVPQRTSIARQLTGSSTVTAGATQRYGFGDPTPDGGIVEAFLPTMVRQGEVTSGGLADYSSTTSGNMQRYVAITLAQNSGMFLFECPLLIGNGLTWRIQNATGVYVEGTAPVVNSKAVFVLDVTSLQHKEVHLAGLPRGTAFMFTYCDVTALSG